MQNIRASWQFDFACECLLAPPVAVLASSFGVPTDDIALHDSSKLERHVIRLRNRTNGPCKRRDRDARTAFSQFKADRGFGGRRGRGRTRRDFAIKKRARRERGKRARADLGQRTKIRVVGRRWIMNDASPQCYVTQGVIHLSSNIPP